MKRFMNKKVAAIGLAAGLALGVAGAAFAYYTSNGSGPGTSTLATAKSVTLAVTTVTLNGPGAAAVSVPYSFTNTTNNGDQTFGAVSITTNSISPVGANTCTNTATGVNAADLSVTTSSAAIGQVNDGATYTSSTVGTTVEPTISMGDDGSDQDGCQGATVHITLSAAQGS